ncbi:MAG: FAD-dependent oxidoreductase [Reyranellaceae bacterium]
MRLQRPTDHARSAGTVQFRFDGEVVQAFAGETIAAALAAKGIVALRRTANGKMRGQYCGMGTCQDCRVTVDGRIGQRACLTTVAEGQDIRSANPIHMPIDALSDLAPAPTASSPETISPDVLVIGAGPGGLSAAEAAALAGASVIVLDERPDSGGQFFKPLALPLRASKLYQDRQFEEGRALIDRVRCAGVTIVQGVTVLGAFSPHEISAAQRDRQVVYTPRRLILAPGAYERSVPFPGWTTPGVMTTGAAQTLARSYGVAPGSRILIAGNGPLNLQLAHELLRRGADVVAVLEAADPFRFPQVFRAIELARRSPRLAWDGLSYLRTMRQHGVPLLRSRAIHSVEGGQRVEAAYFGRLRPDGSMDSASLTRLEVDAVCVGYGFLASTELARILGCDHHTVQSHLSFEATTTSDNGATSVDGVYAVGDGAEPKGARVAMARGYLAGQAAARELGFHADSKGCRHATSRLRSALRFQSSLWSMFKAPPVYLSSIADETIACRCEEISFGALRRAVDDGFDSIAALRRKCRLAMGHCQGRYCVPTAVHLLRAAGHTASTADFTTRFPAKPVPVSTLTYEKPEWGSHAQASPVDLGTPPSSPPLPDRTADIVVIGAGIMGACLAYYLSRAGLNVVVLDRDDANKQASGSNAGSLHVQLLSYDFGSKAQAGGGPAAAALPLGPKSVALWRELQQDCREEFELATTGGLMVADSEAGMGFLRAKASLERSFGIDNHIVGPKELRDLAPALSDRLAGAEYVPLEGKINPLRATYGVLNRAKQLGAVFLRGANVTAIERIGTMWRISTSRCRVDSPRVVNAAGPWAREIASLVGIEVPVRGSPLQMIVTERSPPLVTQLLAHADRHLSLKQASTGGMIIGGAWPGRRSPVARQISVTRESVEGNLWVAALVLPHLRKLHVIRAWAAMNINIDGAPILGEVPGRPGFFNAVTSSGYTLAPAVAFLTSQIVAGKATDIDVSSFSIERF